MGHFLVSLSVLLALLFRPLPRLRFEKKALKIPVSVAVKIFLLDE
jgi:hypothetical protein